jgi:hypothetical protein
MRKTILLSVAVLLAGSLLAQKQKGKKSSSSPVPKTYSRQEYAKMINCSYEQRINEKQLLKQFPFNKAKEIRLVSFENSTYDSLENRRWYSESLIRQYKYNEKRWRYDSTVIDTVKWEEEKILDRAETLQLADILFNIGFYKRPTILEEWENGCYSPRNALAFYDSKGELFSMIEICFECEAIRTAPDKMNIGDMCTGKFDLLKKFFIKSGIKYGTVKTDQSN